MVVVVLSITVVRLWRAKNRDFGGEFEEAVESGEGESHDSDVDGCADEPLEDSKRVDENLEKEADCDLAAFEVEHFAVSEEALGECGEAEKRKVAVTLAEEDGEAETTVDSAEMVRLVDASAGVVFALEALRAD